MKLLDRMHERISNLLSAPMGELGSWARVLRYQIQLWRFCGRRLRENNAMAMSAALSYRAIFAMVPTLVLIFLFLKPLGVISNAREALHDVLEEAGLTQIAFEKPASEAETQASAEEPTTQEVSVAEHIEGLVESVEGQLTIGRLGPVGVLLLVWTALTLLTTIERSLNRIFGAKRARPLGHRVLLYWSALTLGPLLLVVTVYLANRATSMAEEAGFLPGLIDIAGRVTAFVIGVSLLAWLYKLMPNTHVRFKAAFGGALVAVPLWLLAKWAFLLYVTEVVGRHHIYGALGLIPLSLLWLNLSWYIFLFGAELAHTAASITSHEAIALEDIEFGPWHLLAGVLAVSRQQTLQDGPASLNGIAQDMNMSPMVCEELLKRLADTGAVCMVEGEAASAYVLARSAEKTRVFDVLQSSYPTDLYRFQHGGAQPLVDAIKNVQKDMESGFADMSVASTLQTVQGQH